MIAEGEIDRVLELSVESQKCWKASCTVFAADVVLVLADTREWKPGVHVEDGDEVELMRQSDDVPEQTAIWRVG